MCTGGPRSPLTFQVALLALLATGLVRAEPIPSDLDETIEAHLQCC